MSASHEARRSLASEIRLFEIKMFERGDGDDVARAVIVANHARICAGMNLLRDLIGQTNARNRGGHGHSKLGDSADRWYDEIEGTRFGRA